MNEDPLPHLEDILHRRELSPDEQRRLNAWLVRHPDAAPAWVESARLARATRQLPDIPVPSNFTARVLDEIRRDAAKAERARDSRRVVSPWWQPRFWIPAMTTAVVVAVAMGGWEWRTQTQQAEFKRDVTQLRTLASVPQEVLEDFDAIQGFSQSSPPVDFELLAALE